ncbi:MAG: cytochrome P450 [Rhizobiaceae bacterium]|nr:cytochrome P450 [Rhizobiaceae bacterium]MCV0404927.1 cytochrome P450 [Rhizobiaceae bacterium]
MRQVAIRTGVVEAPFLDIDPYALDVLNDPYPFHEALREKGPVARIAPHGVYAVGRHDESAIVLGDHNRFTAAGGIGIQDIRKPGEFRIPNRLLENDPPSHTAIRGTLTKILSPIVIRRWREHFEKEAVALARQLVERGTFDGVADVAETYVLKVFPEAVGIELPRDNVLAISEMRFNQSGPQNELYHRAMAKAQPYLDWFENSTRRDSVRRGSLAEMLFEAEDRGEFDEGIASNMVRTFVGGGTDSTITGIGHALHLLARNPEQWALLKADPARVKTAFEEAIRLETPFQVTYRTTRDREVELSGVRLDPDTKIGVFLGAANRDPRKWSDPSRFDVTRDTTGVHLGFGVGAHNCIGQMIARLEAEAILKAIVTVADTLELDGEPRLRPINQMRQLDYLPLRIGKA